VNPLLKFPVLIFGAGSLGQKVLSDLRNNGIEPVAFMDNSQQMWYTTVDGLTVVPPGEARLRYGSGVVCVVAVYNHSTVRSQLRILGFKFVIQYTEVYRNRMPSALPFYCLEKDNRAILENRESAVAASDLWDDETSRDYYNSQLLWHDDLATGCLPQPCPAWQTYFPPDLVQLRDDEVFGDCGAYNGDTLLALLYKTGGKFKGYHAFEPDPSNYKLLRNTVNSLDTSMWGRIGTRQLAVSDHVGKLAFEAKGSVTSTVANSSSLEIPCFSLDGYYDVTCLEPPTYIKMDIEGHELQALAGAKGIIQRHQPILAICTYHHLSDLWRLPLTIKESNPSYKMFFRMYAEDCWESVCYAIPEHRLIKP
jgi:FkbM family methyltransferase